MTTNLTEQRLLTSDLGQGEATAANIQRCNTETLPLRVTAQGQ